MKIFINTCTLVGILLISGCTKVVYTHQQVIERYRTKQDLVNRFGQPAERMVVNDQEQWLYNFDRSYISSPTKDVTQFSRPKKYLLFTLDAQGKVLKSESSRVDLSERKPAAGKTIALVAGAAIIVTLVIAGATLDIGSGLKF